MARLRSLPTDKQLVDLLTDVYLDDDTCNASTDQALAIIKAWQRLPAPPGREGM